MTLRCDDDARDREAMHVHPGDQFRPAAAEPRKFVAALSWAGPTLHCTLHALLHRTGLLLTVEGVVCGACRRLLVVGAE